MLRKKPIKSEGKKLKGQHVQFICSEKSPTVSDITADS